jgi:gliding motility-associated lipoprotein GldB
MKKIIAFLIGGFLLWSSCKPTSHKKSPDVSSIPVHVEILRFDLDFFGNDPKKIHQIRQKYPYLFPANSPDSLWTKKMNDSLFLSLKKQVDSVFPDLLPYKQPLENLFKHIKYYFPDFKEPKIVTIYSNWNYLNKVIYTDSLMFISLDNFLGKENPVYRGGIPEYIRQNLTPERIPVEAAMAITEQIVSPSRQKALLYKMINEGKKMYLLENFLPKLPDSLLLGYSAKKYQWAKNNEENVWKYYISNKLLYETDPDLDRRFINMAPYSKFYTENDMESPGRIGLYTGWQIVRSFMQNNDVSLQNMIKLPEEEIFKKSKYKPKK